MSVMTRLQVSISSRRMQPSARSFWPAQSKHLHCRRQDAISCSWLLLCGHFSMAEPYAILLMNI